MAGAEVFADNDLRENAYNTLLNTSKAEMRRLVRTIAPGLAMGLLESDGDVEGFIVHCIELGVVLANPETF